MEGETEMNLFYWLKILKISSPIDLRVDQAIANELNNQEWEQYFKTQQEEFDKQFKTKGNEQIKSTIARVHPIWI